MDRFPKAESVAWLHWQRCFLRQRPSGQTHLFFGLHSRFPGCSAAGSACTRFKDTGLSDCRYGTERCGFLAAWCSMIQPILAIPIILLILFAVFISINLSVFSLLSLPSSGRKVAVMTEKPSGIQLREECRLQLHPCATRPLPLLYLIRIYGSFSLEFSASSLLVISLF